MSESVAETVERVSGRDPTDQSAPDRDVQIQRLRTMEQDCDSLIESRQTDYVDALERNGPSLREYLYRQPEWTHPVVGDALDIIKKIRKTTRQIQTRLFDRV